MDRDKNAAGEVTKAMRGGEKAWICRHYRGPSSYSEGGLPENEVVDFKLRLYHACRPQSHSKDICLCGHVVWRSDAAHVFKETERRAEREKKRVKRTERDEENNLRSNWRSNEGSVTGAQVHCFCLSCRLPVCGLGMR